MEKAGVQGRASVRRDGRTDAMRAKRSLIDGGVDPVACPDAVTPTAASAAAAALGFCILGRTPVGQ